MGLVRRFADWLKLGRGADPSSRLELIQVWALVIQGSAALIAVIRTAIVARTLGAEEYGVIGLTLAVGNIIAVLQHMGLGVGAAKEAAHADSKLELSRVTVTLLAVRLALLIPLLLVLVLVVGPAASNSYDNPELRGFVTLHAISMLFSAPGDIFGYVLSGAEHYRSYLTLRLMNEVLLTLGVVLFVYTLGTSGYFVGLACAGAAYTIVSGAYVRRAVGRLFLPRLAEVRDLLRSVFRTTSAVYFVKLTRSLMVQLPILVGGVFLPLRSIGILRLGLTAGGLVSSVMSGLTAVTLSRMTRKVHIGGQRALFDLFKGNFRRLNLGVSALVAPVIVFSPEFALLVGGESFVGAGAVARIALVFYALVALADNLFAGLYLPLDQERKYIRAYVLALVATSTASLLMIPSFPSPTVGGLSLLVGGMVLGIVGISQVRSFSDGRRLEIAPIVVAMSAITLALSSAFVADVGFRLLIALTSVGLIVVWFVRWEPMLLGRLRNR